MSNVSIYGKRWIDLVFEDRNQMYGAYQLRQENPKVTLLALFYGVLLFGGIASVLIISSFTANNEHVAATDVFPDGYILKVTNFQQPVSEPEVAPAVKTTPPNTVTDPIVPPEINKFSHLTVAATPQVLIEVPTNDELKNIVTPAIVGQTASLGIGTTPGVATGTANNLNGSGNITPGDGGISKSTEVDKLPEYPGGINKFYTYVANNFRNPDLESGTMVAVLVAFVVEKDGTLSNIRVIRNSGIGTEKEAIRVLSALKTKWTPGFKNGEKVRTEFTLPIKVKFN